MVLHIMPDDIYLQLTFTFWAGGNSGGNFTYTRTTGTPLGIKLATFEISQHNGNCMLQWATSSEKDNRGFYIERSNDGRSFETLDFVSAKAGAQQGSAYAYTDLKPHNGINYYRLKQVDLDGRHEYSWLVNTVVKTEDINVYPNPATDVIYLKTKETKTGSWKLSNALGTTVKRGSLSFKEINISELPAGMYLLTIMDGQQVTTKNVIKL